MLLVEAGPRVLPSFPERLSAIAERALERLGVETVLGHPVTAVDADGVEIDGKRIPAATVLWAAGVAASPAGKWLGAERDRAGRIKVAADLSVPGHPEIFAVGDTVLALGRDGAPLPGVAPVAKQQGSYVARVIRARVAGRHGAQALPLFQCRQPRDHRPARRGRRFRLPAALGLARLVDVGRSCTSTS